MAEDGADNGNAIPVPNAQIEPELDQDNEFEFESDVESATAEMIPTSPLSDGPGLDMTGLGASASVSAIPSESVPLEVEGEVSAAEPPSESVSDMLDREASRLGLPPYQEQKEETEDAYAGDWQTPDRAAGPDTDTPSNWDACSSSLGVPSEFPDDGDAGDQDDQNHNSNSDDDGQHGNSGGSGSEQQQQPDIHVGLGNPGCTACRVIAHCPCCFEPIRVKRTKKRKRSPGRWSSTFRDGDKKWQWAMWCSSQ